jgi:hypothetical protein
MRYAVAYKADSEVLDQFVRRGDHVRGEILDRRVASSGRQGSQTRVNFLFRTWRLAASREPTRTVKSSNSQLLVYDDGVLTKPWSAAVSYRRPIGQWPEMVFAETTRDFFTGGNIRVPTADKPDF